jgi:hypothetical protein
MKIVLTLNNQPLEVSRHHKPKTEPINLLLFILFPKTVKPPNRKPNRLFPCFNLRPLELRIEPPILHP